MAVYKMFDGRIIDLSKILWVSQLEGGEDDYPHFHVQFEGMAEPSRWGVAFDVKDYGALNPTGFAMAWKSQMDVIEDHYLAFYDAWIGNPVEKPGEA